MHLIAPLANGFPAAEDGTVDIYLRGTSTRAQIFDTFEGDNPHTPSASITLDQNGAVTAYVYAFVDVVVKGANGELVESFTAGDSSPNVEVISRSFTGTNYDSGGSGYSQPTDLGTVLDRWYTSAGAIDFNVLAGGVSVTIQAAIASIAGMFFNVKSPVFGAIGDGSNDDTSAIQAAITAASSGGIIFFPPGTYKITSALAVGTKASLLGCGANSSKLLRDHASNHLLSYTSAAASSEMYVQDLMLYDNQNNSGDLIHATAAVNLVVHRCVLGSSTTSQGTLVAASDTGSYIHIDRCLLTMGSAAGSVAVNTGGACTATFNQVSVGSLGNTRVFYLQGENSRIIGNTFDCSASTGAPEVCGFYPSDENDGTRVCAFNHFTNASSGAIVAMNFNREGFTEIGNSFGDGYDGTTHKIYGAFSNIGGDATQAGTDMFSMWSRKYYIASNAGITLKDTAYGVQHVVRSTNADQTLTLAGPNRASSRIKLYYFNGSGGNIAAVTMTTVKGLANFAVVAGDARLFTFEAVNTSGTTWQWVLASDSGAFIP